MTVIIGETSVAIDDVDYCLDRTIPTRFCLVHILSRQGEKRKLVLKCLNPVCLQDAQKASIWKHTFEREYRMFCPVPDYSGAAGAPRLLRPTVYQMISDITCGENTTFGLLSECISGALLSKWIREYEGLPKRLFRDVCATLRHYNALHYYHMDLSSDNMIVSDENRSVWLIDFTGAFCFENGKLLPVSSYTRCFCGKYGDRIEDIRTEADCVRLQADMLLCLFEEAYDGENDDSRKIRFLLSASSDPLRVLTDEMDALLI